LAVFIIECFELLSSRLMRSRLALSRQVSWRHRVVLSRSGTCH
jgi:hypothetical protein